MIVRLVRLTFHAHHLEAFEALFWTHRDAIVAQPGCQSVELMADPTNPCVRLTLSRWDSEDSLNAYRKSALFGQVWPATKALFDEAPEAWTYHTKASE